MSDSKIEVGRRLTVPMVESLETSKSCKTVLDKIDSRGKSLEKASREIVAESKTCEGNTEALKALIDLEIAVTDELKFLQFAKGKVQERQDSFITVGEEEINAHAFEECKWEGSES